ncbi:MAG: choice-of-anchor L domain-containing protein [Labilithrix sp.]
MKTRLIAGALLLFGLVAACSSGDSSELGSSKDQTDAVGANGFGDGKKHKDSKSNDNVVETTAACDDETGDTATDFAHAMGICHDAKKDGFGLVKAEFTRGFNDPSAPESAQHGTLSKFGSVIKPREGQKLGILSTGFADEFNGSSSTPFYKGKHWWHDETVEDQLPAGFPKAAGDCAQESGVSDIIVLKLTLKAPPSAGGFKFDFNFHSSEWPEWICTKFNDGFIAYLTSKGKTDNISFDSKDNPVSVNNAFFDRCTPNVEMGCEAKKEMISECPSGDAELAGTGYGIKADACDSGKKATQGGATGWLSSSAPIEPDEEFTLELAIWDTGDGDLDSSVLLDNFRWVGGATQTTTERPSDVK